MSEMDRREFPDENKYKYDLVRVTLYSWIVFFSETGVIKNDSNEVVSTCLYLPVKHHRSNDNALVKSDNTIVTFLLCLLLLASGSRHTDMRAVRFEVSITKRSTLLLYHGLLPSRYTRFTFLVEQCTKVYSSK